MQHFFLLTTLKHYAITYTTKKERINNMATTKAIVKEINLTLKPQELETILDALWDRVEDMETGNDDLSLRTIHVGRLPFYKVDKGLCEHQREWYIRYSRLAKQLDKMVIKIRKLKGA